MELPAGVRRIEARAGLAAQQTIQAERGALAHLCQELSASPTNVYERLSALQREIREQRKEIQQLKQKQSAGELDDVFADAEELGDAKLIVHQFQDLDMEQLRQAADLVKGKLTSYAAVLGSAAAGKVSLIGAVSPDLHDRLKANELIKEIAKLVKGGGGGRPDMAQAGGKDPAKLGEALDKARQLAREKLS